jgi:3-oxoacyl-[acyl-carrier protein] reductase
MEEAMDSKQNGKPGKVAIVTGAARGIGAAIAERLAADGMTVVINYTGSTGAAEALARKIEQAGGPALTAQADVRDPAAVARMFDAAETAFGGVDVLVNNAGIMRLAPLAESDDALFDSQVAVNLKGSFNTLREAARRRPDHQPLVERRGALSARLRRLCRHQGGHRGDDACAHQRAARPQHHGERHRAGADGDRALPRRQAAAGDRPPDQARAARLGRPEDIAAAVAFLAGPDGGWINGQVLRANGGII